MNIINENTFKKHLNLLKAKINEIKIKKDYVSIANKLSPEELRDMRSWMLDCSWADLKPSDIPKLSPAEVVRAVDTHYEGGLSAWWQSYE